VLRCIIRCISISPGCRMRHFAHHMRLPAPRTQPRGGITSSAWQVRGKCVPMLQHWQAAASKQLPHQPV
jgi:hypothetical protein